MDTTLLVLGVVDRIRTLDALTEPVAVGTCLLYTSDAADE